MGAKEEINEMLDSMERVADDEPFTEPPQESQKPDEIAEDKPPATEEPKEEEEEEEETEDESDEAKPPATTPPSEKDEVTKLRERIAELEASSKAKEDNKPPSTDPPISERDFLTGVDLDDIRDDPTILNKLLNKIYAQAVADARNYVKAVKDETFETLPTKVTQQLEVQRTLQQLTENFYQENPDLGKFKKVVGVVFDETIAENPGMKIPDVLRKVGEETRKRLELPKPSPAPKDKKDTSPKGDAPPLPRRKGSRVPNPKPAEPSSIRSQIDEMNKTLGR